VIGTVILTWTTIISSTYTNSFSYDIPARKLKILVSMLARYFGTGQLKQLEIEPNINFHSIHFVDIFGHVNKEI